MTPFLDRWLRRTRMAGGPRDGTRRPLDVEPIRNRVAAATPGPWRPVGHEHGAVGCRCLSCHDTVGYLVDHPSALHCDDLVGSREAAGELNEFGKPLSSCEMGPLLSWADAEFCAQAREDVPALLAEVDRLRRSWWRRLSRWVGWR